MVLSPDIKIMTAKSIEEGATFRDLMHLFGVSEACMRSRLVYFGLKPHVRTPQVNVPNLPKRKAQFWARVNITADPDECWEWQGCRGDRGYGQISMQNVGMKERYTHIIAFMFHTNSKPKHWVLHHCDNPPCCNPKHLYDGTPTDNAQDRERRNRHPHGTS